MKYLHLEISLVGESIVRAFDKFGRKGLHKEIGFYFFGMGNFGENGLINFNLAIWGKMGFGYGLLGNFKGDGGFVGAGLKGRIGEHHG